MFVGIDYSLSSPAVCIYDPKSFADCRFHFLTGKKKYATKFGNITGQLMPEWSCEEDRHLKIASWAIGCIPTNAVVAIEDYAYAASGRVFDIAENTGLLKHLLWQAGFNVTKFAPTEIKKYATGRGNAGKGNTEKGQMQLAFITQVGIDLKLLLGQTAKSWNPSSDLIDAYFISKYLHHLTTTGKVQTHGKNK